MRKKTAILLYKIQTLFLLTPMLLPFNNVKSGKSKKISLSDYKGVAICDYRYDPDPNMCVKNSYLITDEEDMEAIIDKIIEYNKKDDIYGWCRTKDSMLNEWAIHNMLYQAGIFRSRTGSVDFDNSDEVIYRILRR